jgi:hypothetical protein
MLNVLTRNFIVGAPEAPPEAPPLEIDEELPNGVGSTSRGKFNSLKAQKIREKYSETVCGRQRGPFPRREREKLFSGASHYEIFKNLDCPAGMQ